MSQQVQMDTTTCREMMDEIVDIMYCYCRNSMCQTCRVASICDAVQDMLYELSVDEDEDN